jgi:hypothetical protein
VYYSETEKDLKTQTLLYNLDHPQIISEFTSPKARAVYRDGKTICTKSIEERDNNFVKRSHSFIKLVFIKTPPLQKYNTVIFVNGHIILSSANTVDVQHYHVAHLVILLTNTRFSYAYDKTQKDTK